MHGRLRDAWQFVWPEIWLPLEESEIWSQLADRSEYTTDQLYVDVYVELVKALKKAPQPTQYDAIANDPLLARLALSVTPASALRGETATARFFENAFEAISESGSRELEDEFRLLVSRFLEFRNLRYELIEPFELRSHLPGVFEAIVADVIEATNQHPQLSQAFSDFTHSFRALQRSHAEADMKTCIHRAGMLAEALASIRPEARGNNFGALCNSLGCWPNQLVREAVKKLYEFSSDSPGVRHNIIRQGNLPRALEMRDSMIVPLILVTATSYFGSNTDLLDTLRSHSTEPPQEPPDPPAITESAANVALP
jgi:hypothetical protein